MSKKRGTSPTQRTTTLLRARGIVSTSDKKTQGIVGRYEITERWNPHAKVRQDLFGFIDVLVLASSLVGLQITSANNLADRQTKILEHPNLEAWLGGGARVLVIGWGQAASGVWKANAREVFSGGVVKPFDLEAGPL